MLNPVDEYIKYLIVSQTNYTQDYLGDHHNRLYRERINQEMRHQKLKPSAIWRAVKGDVIQSKDGFIIFDDTTLDKRYSQKIEVAQYQYSGKDKRTIMGIGVVTCVYVNPHSEEYWLIDERVYHKEDDGNTKLDHARDMLDHCIDHKKIAFKGVLMDTWYATNDFMKHIDGRKKFFYCPIQCDRSMTIGVNWTKAHYLNWDDEACKKGQGIRLKKMSKEVNTSLYRLSAVNGESDTSYDYIVTNDIHLQNAEAVEKFGRLRWKIEQVHREWKQTAALEKCQCVRNRAQRNHIVCSALAWVWLKRTAKLWKTTIYQVKLRLLDFYINLMVNNPLPAT